MRRSAFVRVLLFSAVIALFVWAARLPVVRNALQSQLVYLRGLGTPGLVIVALFYTPIAILLLPASLLTLGTGFLFPFVPALIAVSLGSTLAAAAAFLVGRTVGRRWVEHRFSRDPRFLALDRAVAQRGFYIVLLTRLSPAFPYVLLNYVYSLTRISFRDFVLASWIGMIPGTVLYVYLGSLMESLASPVPDAGRWGQALLALGLIATAAVTIVLGRIATRTLSEVVAEQPIDQGPSPGMMP